MRVALVSPYDLAVPGGVQSHVQQLAAGLRDAGDEVVVLGPGADTATGRLGRSVRVPFNGSVAPIALAPTAARTTARRLAALRPDVVHVHEPLVPVIGPAAVRADAPVVATFHAWSDRSRAYRAARGVGRRVLARVDAALAVSDAAAAYHAGALGVPTSTFRVVPNGVEVARFADATPLARIHDPERPTVLFVGRLERRKGLEVLVRAFTALKTERPDVRLLVVGDGSEGERCRDLLPERLRSDVHFLGRVAADELPGCYAAADLYVSPALGGESFGIVLLEAMATNTPVVASDIPGYRGVLRDGETGRLVTPGDARALATTLGALLDNPALRSSVGREGRRAAAAYDWPVVTARVREIYEAVAARR